MLVRRVRRFAASRLPGTNRLRALVVCDEIYGFVPPHPANPPTKRPIVALMKQARAFGVGVVLATESPMDLDYRALSNARVRDLPETARPMEIGDTTFRLCLSDE